MSSSRLNHPRAKNTYVSAMLARTEQVAEICKALHKVWTSGRPIVEPGIREPRFKTTTDAAWVAMWQKDGDRLAAAIDAKSHYKPFRMLNGKPQADIANLPFQHPAEKFAGLPVDHRLENERSAQHVLQVVLDAFLDGSIQREGIIDELSSNVHDAWVSRNYKWAPGTQMTRYEDLSQADKDLDIHVVEAAVGVTRTFFRELWGQAMTELGRTVGGELAKQGMTQAFQNRLNADGLVHAELLAQVAHNTHEIWRELLPEGVAVWQPTTDVAWIGRNIRSHADDIRLVGGTAELNIAAFGHDELPELQQQKNVDSAAHMTSEVWMAYTEGRSVDPDFAESLAREEHESYRERQRQSGIAFRRPELDRNWDLLSEQDKSISRSRVIGALVEVEMFLQEVATYRIGSVDLTSLPLVQDSIAAATMKPTRAQRLFPGLDSSLSM